MDRTKPVSTRKGRFTVTRTRSDILTVKNGDEVIATKGYVSVWQEKRDSPYPKKRNFRKHKRKSRLVKRKYIPSRKK